MTDILVKARLKEGHKAELAAQLAGGTLAKGNPYEDALQMALRRGYAIDNEDDAFITFPSPDASGVPPEARRVLERYFHIDREMPRDTVAPDALARIRGYTSIPEWLGINAENWRND